MPQTDTADSNTLVSQVVTLWSFVLNQFIESMITIIIIWTIAGASIEAAVRHWITTQFTSDNQFLHFLEQVGLKDKLWIIILVALLSILYLNVRLTNVASRLIPSFSVPASLSPWSHAGETPGSTVDS
jgi:hypothetical protein